MKRYIVKALVCAALFCGISTAVGAVSLDNVTYKEDYEAHSIGSAPASSSSGISLSGFGEELGLTATVQNDSEGDKALCMKYTYKEDADAPTGTLIIGRKFTAKDSTMSIKVMVEDTSSTINIGFRESSSARMWPVVISGGIFKDLGGAAMAECIPGTWYKIDMNYTSTNDTLTISINGEKKKIVSGASAYLNMAAESTTTRIQYMPSGMSTTGFWIDDYSVTESNGFIKEPVCLDENGNKITALKSGVLSFVSDAENNSNDGLPLVMLIRVSQNEKVMYIGWTETVIESGKGGRIGAEITVPEKYDGYEVECMVTESLENAKAIVKSLKLK